MTDRAFQITDDLLHAYVDGFLDESARREVEQYLTQHAETAARVRAWQTINQGLMRLGDDLTHHAGPAPRWKGAQPGDDLSQRRARKGGALWLRAAAVAASLAVGAIGGWIAHTPRATMPVATAEPSQVFIRQATVAYKVFASAQQARPVEISAEERDRLQRWTSGKMGLNFAMHVPDLAPLGWTLLGGRMLADAQGPAALYVYEDAKKSRLALYVLAMPQDAKFGLNWTPAGDGLIADWGYNRLHMALAGDVDRNHMKSLLGPINQQIVAKAGDPPDKLAVATLPLPQIALRLNPDR